MRPGLGEKRAFWEKIAWVLFSRKKRALPSSPSEASCGISCGKSTQAVRTT